MKRQTLIVQLFNGGANNSRPKQENDTAPNHTREQRVLEEAGFEVETLDPFGWPWNPAANRHNAFRGLDPLRALRVMLARRKAALICAHMESAVVLLLLRRLFRFRPPIVIWEVPWSPGWGYRNLISRLAIPRADCSVVFGTNQIDLLRRAFGTGTRLRFLPFCVDVDFFRPQPPSGTQTPYVFSSGFDVGRDFKVLLEASRGIPAPFIIKCGKALNINVNQHPNVTEFKEYLSYTKYREMYADAAIVVVTTGDTPNASGVTSLMEAMAMGKPTIVSDNPALRDYLPPPDAGVVVPVGDSVALHAAIIDLLQTPGKAEAMGRKAREFAEERFHPRSHFRAMASLFWDVINAAGTPMQATSSPGTPR